MEFSEILKKGTNRNFDSFGCNCNGITHSAGLLCFPLLDS